jgi:hypothetical protein
MAAKPAKKKAKFIVDKKPSSKQLDQFKEYLLFALSELGLAYFRRECVSFDENYAYLKFCLPHNSLMKLVEFCKVNNLTIAYDHQKNMIISMLDVMDHECPFDVWWKP